MTDADEKQSSNFEPSGGKADRNGKETSVAESSKVEEQSKPKSNVEEPHKSSDPTKTKTSDADAAQYEEVYEEEVEVAAVPEPETIKASKPSKAGGKKRKKGEKVEISNCRVGFLGAGKMSEVIVKGLIHFGLFNLKVHTKPRSKLTNDPL